MAWQSLQGVYPFQLKNDENITFSWVGAYAETKLETHFALWRMNGRVTKYSWHFAVKPHDLFAHAPSAYCNRLLGKGHVVE